ncbi:hypothetical protein AB0M68_03465 [Streptomyces sp. NPDC051453]|uniref:hypothetical protein n=1 Tax=Streptomyces sp. NPDC051453 TaxID=3154941 RepID=UPI003415D3F4
MTTIADELHEAAMTLRDVAPQITGRLAGLADPVAAWLEAEAARVLRNGRTLTTHHALAVARAVNGTAE